VAKAVADGCAVCFYLNKGHDYYFAETLSERDKVTRLLEGIFEVADKNKDQFRQTLPYANMSSGFQACFQLLYEVITSIGQDETRIEKSYVDQNAQLISRRYVIIFSQEHIYAFYGRPEDSGGQEVPTIYLDFGLLKYVLEHNSDTVKEWLYYLLGHNDFHLRGEQPNPVNVKGHLCAITLEDYLVDLLQVYYEEKYLRAESSRFDQLDNVADAGLNEPQKVSPVSKMEKGTLNKEPVEVVLARESFSRYFNLSIKVDRMVIETMGTHLISLFTAVEGAGYLNQDIRRLYDEAKVLIDWLVSQDAVAYEELKKVGSAVYAYIDVVEKEAKGNQTINSAWQVLYNHLFKEFSAKHIPQFIMVDEFFKDTYNREGVITRRTIVIGLVGPDGCLYNVSANPGEFISKDGAKVNIPYEPEAIKNHLISSKRRGWRALLLPLNTKGRKPAVEDVKAIPLGPDFSDAAVSSPIKVLAVRENVGEELSAFFDQAYRRVDRCIDALGDIDRLRERFDQRVTEFVSAYIDGRHFPQNQLDSLRELTARIEELKGKEVVERIYRQASLRSLDDILYRCVVKLLFNFGTAHVSLLALYRKMTLSAWSKALMEETLFSLDEMIKFQSSSALVSSESKTRDRLTILDGSISRRGPPQTAAALSSSPFKMKIKLPAVLLSFVFVCLILAAQGATCQETYSVNYPNLVSTKYKGMVKRFNNHAHVICYLGDHLFIRELSSDQQQQKTVAVHKDSIFKGFSVTTVPLNHLSLYDVPYDFYSGGKRYWIMGIKQTINFVPVDSAMLYYTKQITRGQLRKDMVSLRLTDLKQITEETSIVAAIEGDDYLLRAVTRREKDTLSITCPNGKTVFVSVWDVINDKGRVSLKKSDYKITISPDAKTLIFTSAPRYLANYRNKASSAVTVEERLASIEFLYLCTHKFVNIKLQMVIALVEYGAPRNGVTEAISQKLEEEVISLEDELLEVGITTDLNALAKNSRAFVDKVNSFIGMWMKESEAFALVYLEHVGCNEFDRFREEMSVLEESVIVLDCASTRKTMVPELEDVWSTVKERLESVIEFPRQARYFMDTYMNPENILEIYRMIEESCDFECLYFNRLCQVRGLVDMVRFVNFATNRTAGFIKKWKDELPAFLEYFNDNQGDAFLDLLNETKKQLIERIRRLPGYKDERRILFPVMSRINDETGVSSSLYDDAKWVKGKQLYICMHSFVNVKLRMCIELLKFGAQDNAVSVEMLQTIQEEINWLGLGLNEVLTASDIGGVVKKSYAYIDSVKAYIDRWRGQSDKFAGVYDRYVGDDGFSRFRERMVGLSGDINQMQDSVDEKDMGPDVEDIWIRVKDWLQVMIDYIQGIAFSMDRFTNQNNIVGIYQAVEEAFELEYLYWDKLSGVRSLFDIISFMNLLCQEITVFVDKWRERLELFNRCFEDSGETFFPLLDETQTNIAVQIRQMTGYKQERNALLTPLPGEAPRRSLEKLPHLSGDKKKRKGLLRLVVHNKKGNGSSPIDRVSFVDHDKKEKFLAIKKMFLTGSLNVLNHCVRTSLLAGCLASLLDLPEKDKREVKFGGLMHDVGKGGDRFLLALNNYPAKLSPRWYRYLGREHAVNSLALFKKCGIPLTKSQERLILWHHFPSMFGSNILAQIISLADWLDAILDSSRSYHWVRRSVRGIDDLPGKLDAYLNNGNVWGQTGLLPELKQVVDT
ncbi:MAG: HD domain-containing protein, partial [Candidatus Omnitrophota bacterium]